MTPLELFIGVCFVGLAFILALVAWSAYRRERNGRLVLVFLAFLSYFFLALLNLLGGLLDSSSLSMGITLVLLNLVTLSLLYLALLKG